MTDIAVADLNALTFAPATVPQISRPGAGRKAAPNPLQPIVNGLNIDDKTSAMTFTVPGPADIEKNPNLRKIGRLKDEAGLKRTTEDDGTIAYVDNEYKPGEKRNRDWATVRWTYTASADGNTNITLWLTAKIVHGTSDTATATEKK